MNDQQQKEKCSGVRDQEIRAALDQHWAASDANDFETEHRVYHEDAVLEYPQSGERTRGRRNIQNQRASQPSTKRFAVRRIIGSGDLWITEFVLTYDGKHETLVKATVPFPRLMTYFVSGVELVGGSFIWLICSGPGKFSADYWLAARLLR